MFDKIVIGKQKLEYDKIKFDKRGWGKERFELPTTQYVEPTQRAQRFIFSVTISTIHTEIISVMTKDSNQFCYLIS